MWSRSTVFIMHTYIFLIHLADFLFCLYLFQFPLNVEQFIDIFTAKRGCHSRLKFVCRQILYATLLPVHYSIKLRALALYPCTHHRVYAVAAVNLYLLKIVEQTTDSEVCRAGEGSHTVAVAELSRLGMGNALAVARAYYANVNALVVNKECEAIKELLLVFIERPAQRLKVCKVETIDECSVHPLADSLLVSLRHYLVYYKSHPAAVSNKRGKAFGKHTDCCRTEIAQLQVELAAVSQSVVEELLRRVLLARTIRAVLRPVNIIQHKPDEFFR